MVADRDGQLAFWFGRGHQRQLLRGEQGAGVRQEGLAIRGQAHLPGRPVQQAPSNRAFEPPQLEADAGLGQSKGFGRVREAAQVGHQDEGLHRGKIQMWAHGIY